jgi:transcriptional regulator with XRE-family HTH domain
MPATSTREQQPRTIVSPACKGRPAPFPPMRKPTANSQIPNSQIPNSQPVQNRVHVLLVHIPRLSIQGQARLAAEVGVSRSTISRLVHGRINPSYRLARGVTTALEKLLGRPLDMREVFSTDGTYMTSSACALTGCGGCLPDRAYDTEGNLRPEWRGQRPGDWSLAPSVPGELCPGAECDSRSGKEGA